VWHVPSAFNQSINESIKGTEMTTKSTGSIAKSIAVMVAVLSGPAAFAVPLVDTASYTRAATDLTAQLLQVSLFDPSLGVLNMATVTFSGGVTSSGQFTNTSNSLNLTGIPITVKADFDATLHAPGPSALSSAVHLFAAGSLISFNSSVNIGPGATFLLTEHSTNSDPLVQTFVFATPADLVGFLGLGKFGYDFSTKTFASFPARFTSVSADVSSLSSARLSVEYDYTQSQSPVPEPAGWALLLAGLGFGGIVLRRNSDRP
jgi:hypothetical protein